MMLALLVAGALAAAQFVPVAGPEGGTLDVDAALVPGVQALAAVAEGRPLVAGLGRAGGVRVELVPEPLPDSWAIYDDDRRAIVLDPAFRGANPRTVATALAHEAVHALGALDGSIAAAERLEGRVAACQAEELRAVLTELRLWQVFHGDAGLANPRFFPRRISTTTWRRTWRRRTPFRPAWPRSTRRRARGKTPRAYLGRRCSPQVAAVQRTIRWHVPPLPG